MKKQHFQLLLLALSLLLPVSLSAQEKQPCVVVETAGGQCTEYLLSAKPRFSCAGNVVTLTAADVSVELSAADVKRIYLSETEVSGITAATQARRRLHLSGSELLAEGLAPGTPVTLYTLDGRQLASSAADPQGSCRLSLAALPTGIVILKTHQQSIKIIRK